MQKLSIAKYSKLPRYLSVAVVGSILCIMLTGASVSATSVDMADRGSIVLGETPNSSQVETIEINGVLFDFTQTVGLQEQGEYIGVNLTLQQQVGVPNTGYSAIQTDNAVANTFLVAALIISIALLVAVLMVKTKKSKKILASLFGVFCMSTLVLGNVWASSEIVSVSLDLSNEAISEFELGQVTVTSGSTYNITNNIGTPTSIQWSISDLGVAQTLTYRLYLDDLLLSDVLNKVIDLHNLDLSIEGLHYSSSSLSTELSLKPFPNASPSDPLPVGSREFLELIGSDKVLSWSATGRRYTFSIDGYYRLTNDIDLGSTEWTPIGSATGVFVNPWHGTIDTSDGFRGTLDGNNRTISNLRITEHVGDFVGLFAAMDIDSSVRNLTISNALITAPASDYVGALVGFNFLGYMINVSVSGDISGGNFVGGIVGVQRGWWQGAPDFDASLNRGLMQNCSMGGSVTGVDNVGGIAGYAIDNPMVDCVNNAGVAGVSSVGGIVGGNVATIFTGCINNGQVEGVNTVGGITSNTFYSNIQLSTNNGVVIGTGNNIGGIVGHNSFTDIYSSVNNGDISGNDAVGGIAGYSDFSTITSSSSTGAINAIGINWGDIVGAIGPGTVID